MKFAAVAFLTLCAPAFGAPPPGFCEVVICNKIERLTLSPWSHIKDRIGEACSPAILDRASAVSGKELGSETRWYQGSSINPTKRSVTRVKSVGACTPLPPPPPPPTPPSAPSAKPAASAT